MPVTGWVLRASMVTEKTVFQPCLLEESLGLPYIEFVGVLIEFAENALRQEGLVDLANALDQLFADWPGSALAHTISLPHLAKWYPSVFLFGNRERQGAESAITRLRIKASGPFAPISTLSGGNQQKVVLARWEAERGKLLLLDEPFQGVDIGARSDIIRAIRSRTDRAILIATSDPEEAFEVADRILFIDRHSLKSSLFADTTHHTLEEMPS